MPVPTAQCPDVCLVLSYQCIGEADNRDDHLTKGGGGSDSSVSRWGVGGGGGGGSDNSVSRWGVGVARKLLHPMEI